MEPRWAEAEAALPSRAAPSLVLIDDTVSTGEPAARAQPPFRGKGAQAIPYLVERGFEVEWADGGQVLLVRRG